MNYYMDVKQATGRFMLLAAFRSLAHQMEYRAGAGRRLVRGERPVSEAG